MKSRFASFVFFLQLITAFQSFSQEAMNFNVQDFQMKTVYNIGQDISGHIWVATPDGLFRFDGENTDPATEFVNSPRDEIIEIHKDRSENLWMYAISGRVFLYRNTQFYSSSTDSRLARLDQNRMSRVYYNDSKNRNWIGNWFYGAYNDFDSTENRNGTFFIAETEHEELYFVEKNGVRFENGRFLESKTTNTNSHRFLSYANGYLKFISGEVSYYDLEKNTETELRTPDHFDFDIIYAIEELDNKIYCATSEGLFVIHLEGDSIQVDNLISPGMKVSSLFVDNDQNVWWGTLGNGLFCMPFYQVAYKRVWDGQNPVAQVFVDSSVFFAVDNVLYKKDDLSIQKLATFPTSVLSTTWISKTQGTLLVGNNIGLFSIGNAEAGYVELLHQKANGNHIGYGAIKNCFEFNGELYIASNRGLFSRGADESATREILDQRVNDVSRNEDFILAATESGLIQIKQGNSIQLTNKAVRVVKSGNGQFYYLTYDGELHAYFESDKGNYEDQLLIQLNFNSDFSITENGEIIVLNSGKLYLLGDSKLLYISGFSDIQRFKLVDAEIFIVKGNSIISQPLIPERSFEYTPTISLSGQFVNNEPFELDQFSNLNYSQNNIRINFKVIDFFDRQFIYQYKLDENWITFNHPELSLNRLSPANYHLLIRVKSKYSDWSNPVDLSFTIKPPFWRTPTFYVICVLVVGFIIYLFFKIRVLTYNRDVVREILHSILNLLKKERKIALKDVKDGALVALTTSGIGYVKAAGNYCEIHHESRVVTVRGNLKNISIRFDKEKHFSMIRIHRSYLINSERIEKINSEGVTIFDEFIPSGQIGEHKEAFRKLLLKHKSIEV